MQFLPRGYSLVSTTKQVRNHKKNSNKKFYFQDNSIKNFDTKKRRKTNFSNFENLDNEVDFKKGLQTLRLLK